MGVTYQSHQSNGAGNATSIAVTKPTSLGVGDLMLAQFCWWANNSATITLPSGFTLIDRQSGGSSKPNSVIAYKVADAGDVAASSFTFSHDGSRSWIGAAIIRVTGQHSSLLGNYAGSQGTGSAINVSSIKQVSRNSLLFFFTSLSNGNYTVSGYSIQNSNPSWTEIYDLNFSNIQGDMSCAYATRLPALQTGICSATASGATTSNVGQIVEIKGEDVRIAPPDKFFNFIYN